MTTREWAKNEVEIIKKTLSSDDDGQYYSLCLDSALKAYECLCDDGHSGMSFGITKSILFKLCNAMPLSPIEDTEDVWNDVSFEDGIKSYQCRRMISLFKDVFPDGTIKYSDVERVICYDVSNPAISFSNNVVSKWFDEHYPITFPYCPTGNIKVLTEEFLTCKENGDFDTIGVLTAKFPDNENVVPIYTYFKFDTDVPQEISKEEYEERRKLAIKNKENETA